MVPFVLCVMCLVWFVCFAVRAYVNNVEGWEGQGELLSKFGVRIEDKTTFVFSREKFTSAVDDNAVLNVEGRPNEGDLIWFPSTKHLFEIIFGKCFFTESFIHYIKLLIGSCGYNFCCDLKF